MMIKKKENSNDTVAESVKSDGFKRAHLSVGLVKRARLRCE